MIGILIVICLVLFVLWIIMTELIIENTMIMQHKDWYKRQWYVDNDKNFTNNMTDNDDNNHKMNKMKKVWMMRKNMMH